MKAEGTRRIPHRERQCLASFFLHVNILLQQIVFATKLGAPSTVASSQHPVPKTYWFSRAWGLGTTR